MMTQADHLERSVRMFIMFRVIVHGVRLCGLSQRLAVRGAKSMKKGFNCGWVGKDVENKPRPIRLRDVVWFPGGSYRKILVGG